MWLKGCGERLLTTFLHRTMHVPGNPVFGGLQARLSHASPNAIPQVWTLVPIMISVAAGTRHRHRPKIPAPGWTVASSSAVESR